jgi:hypothetical protein
VVIPLYHTFGKVFSSCRPLLTYVMRNYNHWIEEQQRQQQQQIQEKQVSK